MKIGEKLLAIQTELKANKGQYNNFGKYAYRSLEDITEAVKPLLTKYKAAFIMSDEIVMIGDRYYIKATASLLDTEKDETVAAYGYAREALSQKGMNDSQITGSTSSYARKYAANGLFAIDDTKDDDTRPPKETPKKPQQDKPQSTPSKPKPPLKDMEFKQWCNQVEAGENPADLAISRKYTLSESQKAVMPLLIKIKNKSPKGILASTDFSCLYDLAKKSDGYLQGVLGNL